MEIASPRDRVACLITFWEHSNYIGSLLASADEITLKHHSASASYHVM